MTTRYAPGAKLLCVTLLAAAVLLIAACGGSSSTRSATAAAGQGVSSEPSPRTSAQAHRDPMSNGVVRQRPMRGTGGNEINDDNPGRADSGNGKATGQIDPCKLVSKAEAQAIIGGPIASPQEAPLGPTCIYQPLGAKTFITLTVESIDFAKIRSQIRDRMRVEVGGRTAYCGDYGQSMTFVPISGGRVLSITAPCTAGTRFAAKALPRLDA